MRHCHWCATLSLPLDQHCKQRKADPERVEGQGGKGQRAAHGAVAGVDAPTVPPVTQQAATVSVRTSSGSSGETDLERWCSYRIPIQIERNEIILHL